MKYTFEYKDETEKAQILSDNKDKHLIEIQNISEGSFLIFSDNPLEDSKQIIYTQLSKEDFDRLENQRQNDTLVQFEVLATIYEELLASKGSV